MKKRLIWPVFAAVSAILLLGGCTGESGQPSDGPKDTPSLAVSESVPPASPAVESQEVEPPAVESQEPEPDKEATEWAWLSTVDFEAYRETSGGDGENPGGEPGDSDDGQNLLDEEGWEVLSGFLPVLEGERSFVLLSDDEPRQIASVETLSSYLTWDYNGPVSDNGLALGGFALCDLDQDGNTELILQLYGPNLTTGDFKMTYTCDYLILHREEDVVYGTVRDWTNFCDLQKNGVYCSERGRGAPLCRMYFQNETWHQEVLGMECVDADGLIYMIGENEVSEEEYIAWTEETWAGEVTWYDPISD